MILLRELTEAWVGNKSWQSSPRSFTADYSRRLKLVSLAVQTASESKVDRAIKSCDSEEVVVASEELASFLM